MSFRYTKPAPYFARIFESEAHLLVLGFSGIHNGEFYRKHYGLRFVGHDAAVAIVRDGEVLFAAEEERFSRQKHTSRFPQGALEAALTATGIRLQDIDLVAYPCL